MAWAIINGDGTIAGYAANAQPNDKRFVQIADNDPRIAAFNSQVRLVSRLQARLALSRAGLLPSVEAALTGELKLWYDDAQVWERDNPFVLQMASALSLTAAQVDALFATAAAI